MSGLKFLYVGAMMLVMSLCVASCSDDDKVPDIKPTTSGTLVDRDGNEYHWVRIGNQCWMTENLRCDVPFYEDIYNPKWTDEFGDGLSLDGNAADWQDWYASFGNYYTWQEAVDNAPEGWRLPTDDDFKVLERTLGMKSKDADKEGWRNGAASLMTQDGEGTMLHFVFGGEVCEGVNSALIELFHHHDYGYYWTATKTTINSEPAAYARKIVAGLNAVNRLVVLQQGHCLSVRYVRDAE